jgi:cell division septation protein DedD
MLQPNPQELSPSAKAAELRAKIAVLRNQRRVSTDIRRWRPDVFYYLYAVGGTILLGVLLSFSGMVFWSVPLCAGVLLLLCYFPTFLNFLRYQLLVNVPNRMLRHEIDSLQAEMEALQGRPGIQSESEPGNVPALRLALLPRPEGPKRFGVRNPRHMRAWGLSAGLLLLVGSAVAMLAMKKTGAVGPKPAVAARGGVVASTAKGQPARPGAHPRAKLDDVSPDTVAPPVQTPAPTEPAPRSVAPPPPSVARQEPAATPADHKTPAVGSRFWQVAAVDQRGAEKMMRSLSAKGFPVLTEPATKGLTRVLVGPYVGQESVAKARVMLEAAGFRPLAR